MKNVKNKPAERPKLLTEEYVGNQLVRTWSFEGAVHTTRNPINLSEEETARIKKNIEKVVSRIHFSHMKSKEMVV